jgi:hypothetical protein
MRGGDALPEDVPEYVRHNVVALVKLIESDDRFFVNVSRGALQAAGCVEGTVSIHVPIPADVMGKLLPRLSSGRLAGAQPMGGVDTSSKPLARQRDVEESGRRRAEMPFVVTFAYVTMPERA